ncbi:BTB/POZ fold [Artemisia annua]|uniref:BTB/POZ fold n=1 Tax=Artemisia annua TaxID=35608 RepID=A0A2U1PS94_ARTAN|nr:BTB/POZ fold [Artemisia annua]
MSYGAESSGAESMLAAMFSGRHTVCKDSEGSVFLDRDGKHFRHILNWLRGGVVPNLSDSECSELLWEAEYYQLLGLVDEITEVLNQRRDDEKMSTDLTRTDIIKFKCVRTDKVSLRGVNLSGLDLSKLSLSHVDFRYACLKNVFFSHAYLYGANFQNADLTNANLEGACLIQANLSGAKLTNANRKGANLQRAKLRGKKFCTTVDTLTQREPHSMLAAMFSGRHTVCKDSEVKRLDDKMRILGLGGGKKFCTTVDTLTQREPHSMLAAMFSGRHTVCKDSEGSVFLDRDGKHFRYILNWLRNGVVPNLLDLEFSELLLEAEYYQLLGLVDRMTEVLNNRRKDEEMDTDLTRADVIKYTCKPVKPLERFRLSGVNLSDLDLSKLNLSNVDFSHACLKNVFFSHANLYGAIFWNADLTNANLEGAYLDCACLEKANLKNADLTNANLEGAYLDCACLEKANLKGAKLTNASLKGANLQRAYLHETDLEGAKLDGANLDGAYR